MKSATDWRADQWGKPLGKQKQWSFQHKSNYHFNLFSNSFINAAYISVNNIHLLRVYFFMFLSLTQAPDRHMKPLLPLRISSYSKGEIKDYILDIVE